MGLFEISAPPKGLELQYKELFTTEALNFVAELVLKFESEVEQILRDRQIKKIQLDKECVLPSFLEETKHIRDSDWRVAPLPERLLCRHVDIGDISPTNQELFHKALRSKASGVQVDFDDGHCPTWNNQIIGLYNVQQVVAGKIPDIDIATSPLLMLRPRAWNMMESNMMVNGKQVPGALFDFGLLMYHNAASLHRHKSGPFFYLSKLENHIEARLWEEILTFTEKQLKLPRGTAKVCVLIENILAAFETHEILYELRDHSLGLNCGVFDYSASIIQKFGKWKGFVLPDRQKYVSMNEHFLQQYLALVVQTCHQRACPVTAGMAAGVLPSNNKQKSQEIIENVLKSKRTEVVAGVDGFLVYDLGLVEPALQLLQEPRECVPKLNNQITSSDLLRIPQGGDTMEGLKHNIAVTILFIYAWFQGEGHFVYKGNVEDSATAEISRSQIWQWIRHQVPLETSTSTAAMATTESTPVTIVTVKLVKTLIEAFLLDCHNSDVMYKQDSRRLEAAARVMENIVTSREFLNFITTYLYESNIVKYMQKME
ncbi:unnamed protein product [Owenia fusiformis]|uniref:malate synthase n=1 Tax=Owenia fusiformis TaxID=6347 RepID=A0A8J1TIZ0_OWEFU|nr:unnamed protein product [Owenia fusiformis]